MKRIISFILAFCVFSTSALADTSCDWTTIKKLPDGGFEYNPTLNLCVGNLVQQNQTQAKQILDLNKAIQLKDLALTTSDQRTQLWMTSANDEMERLNKLSSSQRTSDWLLFSLGALTVIGAGFMTAKLIHN